MERLLYITSGTLIAASGPLIPKTRLTEPTQSDIRMKARTLNASRTASRFTLPTDILFKLFQFHKPRWELNKNFAQNREISKEKKIKALRDEMNGLVLMEGGWIETKASPTLGDGFVSKICLYSMFSGSLFSAMTSVYANYVYANYWLSFRVVGYWRLATGHCPV